MSAAAQSGKQRNQKPQTGPEPFSEVSADGQQDQASLSIVVKEQRPGATEPLRVFQVNEADWS